MKEDAPQRGHCLRGVFKALRYLIKTGCPWGYLPSDFPPHDAVYQQTDRWVERQQVGELTGDLQEATGKSVKLAYVDQGYTGQQAADDAADEGINLFVVKLQEAKRGFVLLPRRWVVERSFAWSARFRRLARDYERMATTLAGYHWMAFISLMLGAIQLKNA